MRRIHRNLNFLKGISTENLLEPLSQDIDIHRSGRELCRTFPILINVRPIFVLPFLPPKEELFKTLRPNSVVVIESADAGF